MTFPFFSGLTRIDYLILRLGNYPQDRGTRPRYTYRTTPSVGLDCTSGATSSCLSSTRGRYT
jgi:hypothetical protein